MPSSTDNLYSQTLLGITTAKLEQLAKKRDTFESRFASITTKTQAEQNDLEKVKILSDGLKYCFGASTSDGWLVRGSTGNLRMETDIRNFGRFLAQARYDPSISSKAISQWQEALQRHLNVQSLKYLYADLYGRLTTEWLSSKQKVIPQAVDDDVDIESFEQVSGTKRIDARLEWERSVFEPAEVTQSEVSNMLKNIFEKDQGSKDVMEALKTLRSNINSRERSLATAKNFSLASLKYTIESLIESDLLTEEKRTVLRGFLENQVILGEIADVLNMRMAGLEEWSWGTVVQMEERRQLTGSFRIYMHEDLLQAIFLQYIGIQWSVAWKGCLKTFQRTKGVWKSPQANITVKERKRRGYFLGPQPSAQGLSHGERKLYRERFFAYQLYDFEQQSNATEQGEEEAEESEEAVQQPPPPAPMPAQRMQTRTKKRMAPRKQMASQARRAIREPIDYEMEADELNYDDEPEQSKNPMENKQRLLHLFTSEIILNTRLHGQMTTFRSQVESLMPTLPHVTILTVMEYLGVSKKWINFFKSFLEAPLQFIDDHGAEPRKRMRGTPGSHVLSEVFSEVVLFCLDFQVNSTTNGHLLWRMGDDFWFWSSDHTTCIKAWRAISNFMNTTGLSLNEKRSGSAVMVQKKDDPEHLLSFDVGDDLPHRPIRWGMLYLNPESGHFEIDQEMVDTHINEMARQLEDKKDSLFAWVQGWNTYATTFFTTNFGKPANCFGRRHVDMMLATHERIQRRIFSSSTDAKGAQTDRGKGSVVEFLRQSIEHRFGIKDIPDGYFFFPSELGGLDVRSPFIGLIQKRETTNERPAKLIDDFLVQEWESYLQAKRAFEAGETEEIRHLVVEPDFRPDDADTFFSFEEYVRHREVLDGGLRAAFDTLMHVPAENSLEQGNDTVTSALGALGDHQGLRGILPYWSGMEPYWKWVAQLYGPEMVQRFGGFRIVDPGLLPTGMVSLLRNARLDWQD